MRWNIRNVILDFIEEYRKQYEEKQLFQKLVAGRSGSAKQEAIPSLEAYTLQPNSMQRAFIYNLLELRKRGMDKGSFDFCNRNW